MKLLSLVLFSTVLSLLPLQAQDAKPAAPAEASAIDWTKAQDLYRRERRGDKLTPEDQAYLDRAKSERQKGGGGRGGAQRKPPETLTPI